MGKGAQLKTLSRNLGACMRAVPTRSALLAFLDAWARRRRTARSSDFVNGAFAHPTAASARFWSAQQINDGRGGAAHDEAARKPDERDHEPH